MGSLAAVLWVSAGAVLLWTAVRSRSQWHERAARPFVALVGTLGVSALGFAGAGLSEATTLLAAPLLMYVTPVLWALFAFEYTGRYALETRGGRFLLALPSAYLVAVHYGFAFVASVVIDVAPWEYNMMMVGALVGELPGSVQIVVHGLNAAQFLANFFVMGLTLVATAVLLGQAFKHDHPGVRVGVVLSVAALAPMLVQMSGAMVAMLSGLPMEGIHLPVAGAYLISAIGFAAIRERHDLFAAAPAAGTIGTRRVLADLPEAVIVVDHDERIVRANPAAGRAFDLSTGVVGEPIERLLDEDVAALQSSSSLAIDGIDGKRHYEPDVSEMYDGSGAVLGYAIVLRDVTDREMRQQRLQVLNRVLRHNLRNEMTTIRGRAEVLAAGDGDASALGDAITDSADDLVELGERAREIERMLSLTARSDPRCHLAPVVDDVLDDVAAGADADVTVDVPDDLAAAVDERLLEPVVRNLVGNAVEHSDRQRPTVEVAAGRARGDESLPVVLRVADDGPGLPDNERSAIERGHENPLEHGSGLGLWAVRWGVTRMGGALSIRDRDPRGTVVEIRLPCPGDHGQPAQLAPSEKPHAD
ncbi:ATP-binding protein [Halomicrobium salinisoli]|uniref:ATP-binding protein n=1 Tax=Halomicrobium salinisoli TaxID=2878391 RepID=UPI001CF0CD50|nr:ATP-binding protein [Halomicrobium salinisoli]